MFVEKQVRAGIYIDHDDFAIKSDVSQSDVDEKHQTESYFWVITWWCLHASVLVGLELTFGYFGYTLMIDAAIFIIGLTYVIRDVVFK